MKKLSVKEIIQNEIESILNDKNFSAVQENPNFHSPKMNLITGTRYKGINKLLTMGIDRFFISIKDAKKYGIDFSGVKTRKIVYYNMVESKQKNKLGKFIKYPFIRYSLVLPLTQCKNIPGELLDKMEAEELKNKSEIKTIADLEKIIKKHNPVIKEIDGGSNYYSPIDDYIGLRKKDEFKNTDAYYKTLLHELSHWTGNKKRLNRKFDNKFGSNDYAVEELIAEIGSCMVAHKFGLPITNNNKAYVSGWYRGINLIKVFSEAGKVFDYLLTK